MLPLRFITVVDFVLESLDEFIFSTSLAKSYEPVRRARGRHEHTNDTALDHAVEITRPALEGGGLCQFVLIRGNG
jgi:hypothetical protein